MHILFPLLIIGYCTVTVHSISLAPPSLWCDNQQLSSEWGVGASCQRYDKASYGKMMNITLLYESLCPGCHNFVTQTLPMVYQAFSSYVNLEFIPFGNAQKNGNKIKCQHGPKECTGNAITSCALHYLTTANDRFKFVQCFETSYFNDQSDPDGTVAKCTTQAGGSTQTSDKIKQCYVGPQGASLQRVAGARTLGVKPEAHKFVPWILVNNVSVHGTQMFQSILLQALCDWYNGPKTPQICQQVASPAQVQGACAN